jgi:hypothetical protein
MNELSASNTQESPMKALEVLLTQLFSAENLSKDPLMVYSMSPDLWVPVSLLSALESVQKVSRDRRILQAAAANVGLEYCTDTDSVRPRLSFERKKMAVWKAFTCEELDALVDTLRPLVAKLDGHGVWEFTFATEAETVQAVLNLQQAGLRAAVVPVNSYFEVLSRVKEIEPLRSVPVLSCLFETPRRSSLYSPQQMLQIARRMPHFEKPGALKLASLCSSVVSQCPRVPAN